MLENKKGTDEKDNAILGPESAESDPQCIKPNLKAYVGTKLILARPMSEDEFLRTIKGMSEDELSKRETQGAGYEVTYEDGYVSWSPKGVFERCYREVSFQENQLIATAKLSPKQS